MRPSCASKGGNRPLHHINTCLYNFILLSVKPRPASLSMVEACMYLVIGIGQVAREKLNFRLLVNIERRKFFLCTLVRHRCDKLTYRPCMKNCSLFFRVHPVLNLVFVSPFLCRVPNCMSSWHDCHSWFLNLHC